ncbi:MAG: response regulator [Proteobacteria bacterium]|nr:MAG: response regulator [Pseudomonadota bacterium]
MFPPHTRILIVDDMPSLRDLLKAYLRRLSFRNISEADDGRMAYQALLAAKASGAPFELVISDWNMPNLDGLEFLKLVRSSPDWKNLPFILLTTESEKAKVIEAVMAQVSNYMVKPVEENTLKEKLTKVWEKATAR